MITDCQLVSGYNTFIQDTINPLTAGAAYIQVFIFY